MGASIERPPYLYHLTPLVTSQIIKAIYTPGIEKLGTLTNDWTKSCSPQVRRNTPPAPARSATPSSSSPPLANATVLAMATEASKSSRSATTERLPASGT